MSDNLQPFNLTSAQKYNSKVSFKLFDAMLEAVPQLKTRQDGQRFALAVYDFQKSCGLAPP